MKRHFTVLTVCLTVLLFGAVMLASCNGGDTEESTAASEAEAVTVADMETLPVEETEAVTEADSADATEESATEVETEKPLLIAPVSPADGADVSLLSDAMTEWLSNYKRGKLDKICDYSEQCMPVPVELSWTVPEGAGYYHVDISLHADMSDSQTYLVLQPQLTLEDLYMGMTYYWQVTATLTDGDGSRAIRSVVFSFNTLNQPRTVYLDGGSNVRDIGGYVTSDGRRIRQGIVYRGAHLGNLTETGSEKAVKVLGIKTELDVSGAKATYSSFGQNINLFTYSCPWYTGIKDEDYREALLNELRVFADPDNYPIYFHCSLGRDRTGTLSLLLLALCGVDQSDIYKDYEVSFWSACGGYADFTATPSAMSSGNLGGTISLLKSYSSSKTGRTLADCTEQFLLEMGLTEDEIQAIRDNLIEDAE